MGGARSGRDLGHHRAGRRPGGGRGGRSRRPRSRRSASPTSARPPSSGSAPPAEPIHRHRLAGSAHRRALRPRCRPRRRARDVAARRAWCSTRTSPAPRSAGSSTTFRCAAPARERGELCFGTIDSWLLWRLTGGARPRDRSVQRLAHAAASTSHARLGRRAAARSSACRARCCPRIVPSAGVFGATVATAIPGCPTAFRSPASRAISRPRSSARRASRRAWPRTPTAPAASCCCNTGGPGRSPPRTACSPRVAWKVGGSVAYALEGSAVHRGRGGAVAARRARAHRAARRRSRRSPRSVPDTGGVYFVPALRRPGRALLGPGRARHRDRASPAAPRARTWRAPRSRASPTRAATCSTPWARVRRAAHAVARRRRRRRERLPDAVPGRRAGSARCCARR